MVATKVSKVFKCLELTIFSYSTFQIKITRSHIEYDEHCGLDKLHIFPGPIPKGGFKITSDLNPVARICGGSLGPPKNAEGKGPKKYHKSFHDGTAQLTRYVDKTCPVKVILYFQPSKMKNG